MNAETLVLSVGGFALIAILSFLLGRGITSFLALPTQTSGIAVALTTVTIIGFAIVHGGQVAIELAQFMTLKLLAAKFVVMACIVVVFSACYYAGHRTSPMRGSVRLSG